MQRLVTQRAAVATAERRRARRRESRLQMRCCIHNITDNGHWAARITDVSARGLGLIANRTLTTANVVSIQLPGPKQSARFLRIEHATPLPQKGWWRVGGSFRKPLQRADVEGLKLLKAAAGPEDSRRRLARLPVRDCPSLPILHIIEEGVWWASIRDVSATGVCLIAERPFKQGTTLTVQLPDGQGGLEPQTLLNVVHVRRRAGSPWWTVGCAFERPISKERLRRLVESTL